jgi:WXG100 family type VII secretion target
MDQILSYQFGEIEHTVRREIHVTAARLNGLLDDLRSQIAPLQEVWTREAAAAYRAEQAAWSQSASALNDMLMRLGNAVGDGAADVSDADRHAANFWHR